MTDRDLAIARAALEAAAKWMRKAGYKEDAPLMLEDCDPAAIVAGVPEATDEIELLRARFAELERDLLPYSATITMREKE